MPRATTAAWLRHAAGAGEDAFGDVHAADVGRLGFAADEDDLLAAGDALLGFFGGEGDLADRRARRGRQALGDARSCSAFGSNVGCSSWSSDAGSTRRIAVFSSISFSFTMSTAIFTAACAVRLPLRVCSMNSLPFSIVNSKSCTSL